MSSSRKPGSLLDKLSWLGSGLLQSWREDVLRSLRLYYWNSAYTVRTLLDLPPDAGPDSFAGFPLASLDIDVKRVEPGDTPDQARATVRVRAVANREWDPAGTSVDVELEVVVARDQRRPFMFFVPGRYGASVRSVRVLSRSPR